MKLNEIIIAILFLSLICWVAPKINTHQKQRIKRMIGALERARLIEYQYNSESNIINIFVISGTNRVHIGEVE